MPGDKLGCHVKWFDPGVMIARKAHFAALRKWWKSASYIEIPPNVLESVYVLQPRWVSKSLSKYGGFSAILKTKAK